MPRPTRAEVDAEIIEAAAELFRAQGYLGTSVQQVADRVGYSKTGLLHRFPSKERLLAAVLAPPLAEFAALRATWAALPPGPERRMRASADLVDLALRHRASVGLVLDSGLPMLRTELRAESGVLTELNDHRTETLAEFSTSGESAAGSSTDTSTDTSTGSVTGSEARPEDGSVAAQLAVMGLVHTVACRQEPAEVLRAPLLRAFRAACGVRPAP
ncbi:TetR/AcrR family transcriptional regulator [Streptomyces sp. XM4193]|uniref:TetR/AcrR family transcriptional regulator n=1 Tax=Streptomyces sp. XM4193 TaxID=2929782 RepID=UPI001FF88E94|nr:TetR/AcrR family transcriptional regulator [Streptomyces sp. XM4193]MCK1794799.1 TetR/AcrR family transcriptional regulator [Streptomyces sp. XM4193]